MRPELMGILAVGGALAGLIWQMVRSLNVHARLRGKMDALARDQQDLRARGTHRYLAASPLGWAPVHVAGSRPRGDGDRRPDNPAAGIGPFFVIWTPL